MSTIGGFEREVDIEERRRKRQEDWEKVRTEDQPEEAPEEPYDGRSLFDRLKEQKDKKNSEIEESKKFKNMIRGLDDDDIDHLDLVDKKRLEEEKLQRQEEMKELREYREKVAAMQEENEDKKLQLISGKSQKLKEPLSKPILSQKSILSAAIKRKSQSNPQESEPQLKKQAVKNPSALKCYAVLPGLGNYDSSDDSDDSSDFSEEITDAKTIDITGRKIKKKKDEDSE
ncbi:PSME3-interacting protein-like [Chironomus tepperi]|uniref:PSME3-interacting protein-like n=1 Tax=Chironomus tepperi TaxID=113505 RepID=UPI00391F7BFC